MARQIPIGTPNRSSRHVFPRNDRGTLYGSLAAGTAVLVVLTGLYFLGVRTVVSPGDVASAHAHIDAQCSQCHTEGAEVADARCARCHDTTGVGRLTNPAHVLLGSGDTVKADQAPEVACIQCHTDHRGLDLDLRAVDDRECAACHGVDFSGPGRIPALATFARHPEFAAFTAQRTSGVGLSFNHVSHFDYVLRESRGVRSVPTAEARAGALETCQRCHLRDPERNEFTPVSFATGCAGSMCHTDDSGALNQETRDITMAYVVEDVPGLNTPDGDGDDEFKIFRGLRHRDPWILFNATWVRATLDPVGVTAERAAVDAAVTWLDQQTDATPPLAGATLDTLQDLESTLMREIQGLDDRISSEATAGENDLLSDAAAAAQGLAQQIADAAGGSVPTDPTLDEELQSIGTAPQDANPQALVDSRRQELLNLLAAIESRGESGGDPELVDRASELRARVEALANSAGEAPPDRAALRRVLTALDEVFRVARRAADARTRSDLLQLQALRENARAGGVGGLDDREFAERRLEIARLLAVLDQLPDAELQRRAANVRAGLDVLIRDIGTGEDVRRRRLDRARLLERVQIEIEFATSGAEVTPPPTPVREPNLLQRRFDDLFDTLSRLDAASAAPRATDDDREDRRLTLTGLLAPCLKCHLYAGESENEAYPPTGQDADGNPTRTPIDVFARQGLRLASVSAAEPVMTRAVFRHAPHLTTTDCAACHGAVVAGQRAVPGPGSGVLTGSTAALDLNSPGVEQCQACHNSSAAPDECATCHLYHPPSAERLLRAVWALN